MIPSTRFVQYSVFYDLYSLPYRSLNLRAGARFVSLTQDNPSTFLKLKELHRELGMMIHRCHDVDAAFKKDDTPNP